MTDLNPRKARVRGTHSTHLACARKGCKELPDKNYSPFCSARCADKGYTEPSLAFPAAEPPTRPDVPHPSEAPPRQEAMVEARPTVHVISLHHTIPSEAFSHCAFTGKVLRFPLVLHEAGYRVVEYANGPSESQADEQVTIWDLPQLTKLAGGDLLERTTNGLDADEELRELFGLMVQRELRKRLKPGDIIAHVFGCTQSAQRIVKAFPQAIHVEAGIGYASGPFGAFRIFESESWRAWHMGHYTLANNGGGGTWPNYPELTTTQVVPNYYDPAAFPLGNGLACTHEGKPYAVWVGRLASIKGPEVVNKLAKCMPELTFKCASGEPMSDEFRNRLLDGAPNIEFLGRVSARSDLAKLYGGAVATIMPSLFWEPFGGVAVESLMCGTPVLCPDYAAFVETVAYAGDGVRCNTPEDYLTGLRTLLRDEPSGAMGTRAERRARAIKRFGIEAVGLRYKAALAAIRYWHGQGLRPEGA